MSSYVASNGVENAGTAPSVGPRPLCIDLFCGLGGWAEGFLAEGYETSWPGTRRLKEATDERA